MTEYRAIATEVKILRAIEIPRARHSTINPAGGKSSAATRTLLRLCFIASGCSTLAERIRGAARCATSLRQSEIVECHREHELTLSGLECASMSTGETRRFAQRRALFLRSRRESSAAQTPDPERNGGVGTAR